MEEYSVLELSFFDEEIAERLCNLIHAYKDALWKQTTKDLGFRKLRDVEEISVSPEAVFRPFLEEAREIFRNPYLESSDFRLFQNCSVSRRDNSVSLVIEAPDDTSRLANEWKFMLGAPEQGVVSKCLIKR